MCRGFSYIELRAFITQQAYNGVIGRCNAICQVQQGASSTYHAYMDIT